MSKQSLDRNLLQSEKERLVASLPTLEEKSQVIFEKLEAVASFFAGSPSGTSLFIDSRITIGKKGLYDRVGELRHAIAAYRKELQSNMDRLTSTGAMSLEKLLKKLDHQTEQLDSTSTMLLIDFLEAIEKLIPLLQKVIQEEIELAKCDLLHLREVPFSATSQLDENENPPWDTEDPLYLTERLAAPIEQTRQHGKDGGGFIFMILPAQTV